MSRELGDLAPIRDVLTEIERLAAGPVVETQTVLLAHLKTKLKAALTSALNTDTPEGFTVEEYARLHGITRAAVYKSIRRGKRRAVRRPGGLIVVDA